MNKIHIPPSYPPTTGGHRARLFKTILTDLYGTNMDKVSMKVGIMINQYLSTDFPELRNEKGKHTRSAVKRLVEAEEMSEKSFDFLVYYVLNIKVMVTSVTLIGENGLSSSHNIEKKR